MYVHIFLLQSAFNVKADIQEVKKSYAIISENVAKISDQKIAYTVILQIQHVILQKMFAVNWENILNIWFRNIQAIQP